ncbi:MAG: hypothetical protein ACKO1J_01750 [Tagaea sp.]
MTDPDSVPASPVPWKLRLGRALRPIRYRWRQRFRAVLQAPMIARPLAGLRRLAAHVGLNLRLGAPRSNVILYSNPWLRYPKGSYGYFSRDYIRRATPSTPWWRRSFFAPTVRNIFGRSG